MRAVVVHEKGGPEQLVIDEVADPTPGPSELVVEVAAAGVNFIDTYHRGGLYPIDFPITPGLEGAGTVVEVGEDAKDFTVGQRVGWTNVLGSYAERHAIPAEEAILIPEEIDLSTAAALLLQGITAHYLAFNTFPLAEGDRCLVHAGAGGVGLLLTQVAKLRGAEVITTVGSEEKATLSEKAGADHVIVYTSEDFQTVIEDAYGPNPLDVVYDGVGATTFQAGLDLLRPRGMMVAFGNASGPPPEISPLMLAAKGSLYLTRPTIGHYIATRDELVSRVTDLFDWVSSGRLDVRIGAEFPLSEAPEAHQVLEGRRTTGKVLLLPAHRPPGP